MVDYVDVGKREIEMTIEQPKSGQRVSLKLSYLDVVESSIADQESQVVLALPSSLLTSSQEAIEAAMSGVHAPAAAEGDQRLHLKLSVEAPSGASPLLLATRRI